MKILYGVQGTGNGHISRANAMARSLAKYPDVEITWLLSGRAPNALLGFGDDVSFRRGLTFSSANGRVSYLRTVVKNNLFQFVRDVKTLNLADYDYLISDYEPVLSWAAKRQGREILGIGHQYAFDYPVPLRGDSKFNRGIMRNFAPVTRGLGFHWHHFGQPIVPPICDVDPFLRKSVQPNKVVVYLPFENQGRVNAILRQFPGFEFYVYSPELTDSDEGRIHNRGLSREGFKQDLLGAAGVVSNSGFELISECLLLGIRMLTKPVSHQVEQLSNAEALHQLEYATVVDRVTAQNLGSWLEDDQFVQVSYPAVHDAIAEWIVNHQKMPIPELSAQLWRDVKVSRFSSLSSVPLAEAG